MLHLNVVLDQFLVSSEDATFNSAYLVLRVVSLEAIVVWEFSVAELAVEYLSFLFRRVVLISLVIGLVGVIGIKFLKIASVKKMLLFHLLKISPRSVDKVFLILSKIQVLYYLI